MTTMTDYAVSRLLTVETVKGDEQGNARELRVARFLVVRFLASTP
jgi:hypothetical protein